MDRTGTPSWINSSGESSYKDKRQRGENKPESTLNSHPNHDSSPAHANTPQLLQTYQYGILRLPANILIEIMTYLKAEELLFFARTTKYFRKVLMKRSSACIWRRALEDLEGLPQCPPTMAEPQFIALVFTEDCSICGKHTLTGLEADLLVRLCGECRKANIVTQNNVSVDIRDLVVIKGRALLSEVNNTTRQLADLKAASVGWAKLAAWKQSKIKELADCRKRGGRLTHFIQQKAGVEKRIRKLYQQAEITRRLRVEGWSTEHMVLPRGSRAHAQWTMHVNDPSILNDIVWYESYLDINRILTDNTGERRQEPRWARLETLWDTVKADLVQPAETKSTPGTLATAVSKALHIKPIPEFSDVLECPTIKELLNTNCSVSEMEARFVQERPAIDREVSAWSERIKTGLADAVRKSLIEQSCITHAPITETTTNGPSNDPLRDLPVEMQLLLRADTIFASYEPGSQLRPSLPFCGYETYMRHLRHWIGYKSDEHWRVVSATRFAMHSTAPAIARALLGALERPLHTTILELEAVGERFVCGRCDDEQPKSWLEMIKYYLDRQEEWGHIAEHMDWFTKNNVAAHNVHDLNSDSPKPLIRLLSPKEPPKQPSDSDPDAKPDKPERPDYMLLCGPCLRASKNAKPLSRFQAMCHLREVHEISEPQLGDLGVDLRKLKKRNYRVIHMDCLEEDGEFLQADFDDDSWWGLESQRGSDNKGSDA